MMTTLIKQKISCLVVLSLLPTILYSACNSTLTQNNELITTITTQDTNPNGAFNSDDHLGFPTLAKFNNKLYLAFRESRAINRRSAQEIAKYPTSAIFETQPSQQLSGHHYGGRVVIFTSTNDGSSWTKEFVIEPPQLNPNSGEFSPYNTNDVKDMTLSVKPASNGQPAKLTFTFVAVNQYAGAEVPNNNGVHEDNDENNPLLKDRIQINVYSELDTATNTWTPLVRTTGVNNDYWFHTTRWIGDKSYSLAYLVGPRTASITFRTGGIIFFGSDDGENYAPANFSPGDDYSQLLNSPYANAVSKATNWKGIPESPQYSAGANEADFAFLDDGSIVAIARKRENEKSYFFGYAESTTADWDFKEIGFTDESGLAITETDIGIHGMELLTLPNGIILATYRRLNVIDVNGTKQKEFCTVISRLNPESGELTEIAATDNINYFDTGYPTMLIDDQFFYFAEYNRFHSGLFQDDGAFPNPSPVNFSEIRFFRIGLEDLYQRISASLHNEMEPIRQYIQSIN